MCPKTVQKTLTLQVAASNREPTPSAFRFKQEAAPKSDECALVEHLESLAIDAIDGRSNPCASAFSRRKLFYLGTFFRSFSIGLRTIPRELSQGNRELALHVANETASLVEGSRQRLALFISNRTTVDNLVDRVRSDRETTRRDLNTIMHTMMRMHDDISLALPPTGDYEWLLNAALYRWNARHLQALLWLEEKFVTLNTVRSEKRRMEKLIGVERTNQGPLADPSQASDD